VNTKELIISELDSTSEELLSEVLQFIKSIKHQHQDSSIAILQSGGNANTNNTPRQRTPNLERGKILMSDDFNDPLPDAFWLGADD
jgi:hypothetical protein